jgi:cytoskeletal protein CcmA (bactofilin family)
MGNTFRGDTIRIDGAGKYDTVDVEQFRVNGTGKVAEDLYAGDARIAGTAKVGGRADVGDLDVDGTVKIEGHVRAETIELDGTGKFGGDVAADSLSGDGTTKIGGDASVDHLRADGTMKVGGNLDGHEVESDGTMKVSGSLVASDARFDGTGKVRGLTDVTELSVDGTGKFDDVNADTLTGKGSFRAADVNAGTFDLSLGGDSAADSVRGTEVRVRRRDSSSASLGKKLLNLSGDDPVFEVGVVEGETVELDATRAETVVGERVTLGADADVETVYTDSLDDHADATVGDVRPREEY